MMESADDLGAPDTDPGGIRALNISPQLISELKVPSISETRCVSPGCFSLLKSALTSTLPASQIWEISFLIRSTIMRFSDLSFSPNSL